MGDLALCMRETSSTKGTGGWGGETSRWSVLCLPMVASLCESDSRGHTVKRELVKGKIGAPVGPVGNEKIRRREH